MTMVLLGAIRLSEPARPGDHVIRTDGLTPAEVAAAITSSAEGQPRPQAPVDAAKQDVKLMCRPIE